MPTEFTDDTSPECAPFTCVQSRVLQVVATTTGLLSMMCSAYIALHIFARRRRRKPSVSEHLVGCMAISDVFASAFFALGRRGMSDPLLCTVQGAGIYFFTTTLVVWTCALASHLYVVVVLEMPAYAKAFLPLHHFAVWGSAGVLTVVVSIVSGYGDADLWCWIRGPRERLVFFYLLVGLACAVTAAVYVRASLAIRAVVRRAHVRQSASQAIQLRVNLRIIAYLATFIFVWGVGCINRVIGLRPSAREHAPFLPALLHVLVVPLQGFFNAFIYGGLIDRMLSHCSGDRGGNFVVESAFVDLGARHATRDSAGAQRAPQSTPGGLASSSSEGDAGSPRGDVEMAQAQNTAHEAAGAPGPARAAGRGAHIEMGERAPRPDDLGAERTQPRPSRRTMSV
mmetsp:Transcript_5277/g.17824  ORF Transcript_5277/g.17824 Transcript_5277/m.17824 type:complete len:397 (-) Transcript_5277:102-1292(-)